jgi:hypothetical protein
MIFLYRGCTVLQLMRHVKSLDNQVQVKPPHELFRIKLITQYQTTDNQLIQQHWGRGAS